MKTKNKSERRRVAPQDVRNNAAAGGSSRNFFKLPAGVGTWEPEKAGPVELDILPYEVKSDNHPDNVERGTIWYKLPFAVHRSIGAKNESYVCPASVGKKCPICEEKASLAKDYDKNEEAINALKAQKWVAYNIADPDDSEKVAVFAYSRGKFAGPLDTELEQVPDETLTFYDVKDGKTLKVRFSDDSYEGRKFLTATRFDFTDRKDMNEDEVLGKTVCLEEALNVLPYDKLKSIFLQEEPDEKDAKPDAKTAKTAKDAKGDKGAKNTTKGGSDEDEDEKADGKDEDDEPKVKFKLGARVSFEHNGEDLVGEVFEIDDEDAVVKVNGKKYDVDVEDLEPAEESKTAKTSKEDSSKASKYKFKVGDTVEDDDGNEGICEAIDEEDDEVTIKTKSGKIIVDADDVTLVKDATEKDEDTDEPDFEVGDKVTWDDGDESGVVVKILADKGIAKVKNEDGDTVKVELSKLTKAEEDDD